MIEWLLDLSWWQLPLVLLAAQGVLWFQFHFLAGAASHGWHTAMADIYDKVRCPCGEGLKGDGHICNVESATIHPINGEE